MLTAVENAKAGVMPPGVGPEYTAAKKKTVEEVDVRTKLARRAQANKDARRAAKGKKHATSRSSPTARSKAASSRGITGEA